MIPREWSRGPQWVSDRARSEWEPVLRRAAAAWQAIEVSSITAGVRDSALVFLTPDELPVASRDCSAQGLEVSILSALGPAGFRCAVHRPGLASEWHRAWVTPDDEAVGVLLGFPQCCRAFFSREWVSRGSTDVTRYMASVDGPWELNIFQRWAGVRLVPHLPCSARCEASLALARKYLQAGKDGGEDVEAIEAVLRLPVEHDARNGVAIVSTPHWRMLVGTDATDGREVVSRESNGESPAPMPTWMANGFSSLRAMRDAHDVVLAAVEACGTVASALDLGCGDGELLRRIADRYKARGFHIDGGRETGERLTPGRWVGVECDAERACHPKAGIVIRQQTIEEWAHVRAGEPNVHHDHGAPCPACEEFDVALIMPGRLLEMGQDRARVVRRALRMSASRVVAYAYGDWARDHPRGVQGLCELAGMKAQLAPLFRSDGVQACLVEEIL